MTPMRLLSLLFFIYAIQANAQSTDESSIRAVIDNVWIAMQKGDTTLLRSSFTDNPTFATIYRSKERGNVLERERGLSEFVNAIASPRADTWYEETWNYRIQINGDFASVWCDYAFYLGNTFSHCGVDAFHLHRSEAGWKIYHLSDTRQRLQCEIPAAIRNKHK